MIIEYLEKVTGEINEERVKEVLRKAIRKTANKHIGIQKMQYMIILLIGDFLKEYTKNDFTWEKLCDLQNKNIYDFLQMDTFSYSEEVNSKANHIVNIYRGGRELPGLLYYKEVLSNIFREMSEEMKNNNVLEAKNRVAVQEYNGRVLGEEISSRILNDYPKDSKMEEIIVCEYMRKESRYGESSININTNTNNRFLQKIYKEFYYYYNQKGTNNKKLRIFYYYFSESRIMEGIYNYDMFTLNTLREVYQILWRLEQRVGTYGLSGQIVAFYRFLINKAKAENINLPLKEFEVYAIISDSITKVLKEEFYLILYNPLEDIPKSNKMCIVPNEYTMRNSATDNTKLLFIDFTKIDKEVRAVYKKFYWENDGALRIKHTANSIIKEFTDFIINKAKYKGEFLNRENIYLYRRFIETTRSKGANKGRFKAVRKFLRYYGKAKDKIDTIELNQILDILTLKGLEIYTRGEVITENDLKLIYREFINYEEKIPYGKLYTLALEMFSFSNLRLGEILNLKMDNVFEENGKSYIRYFPKIGGRELITIPIDERLKMILLEAKEITKVFRGNDIIDNYIFIEEYQRKGGGNKRIRFTQVFKGIIINLKDKLEKEDYKPMNIRHTHMNVICEEAIKRNLSLKEIQHLTGDSTKTIKRYYQERHKIELLVETMYGVTISNVDIDGKILGKEIYEKNDVKEKLGKCNEEKCTFDIAECLICNNFITFVNRKNVFLKRIEECNKIIESTTNDLIKKEKYAEKTVLAKYLAEIMKLEVKKEC